MIRQLNLIRLVIVLTIGVGTTYAQNITTPLSTDAWGTGGATTTTQNAMAVFHNPAVTGEAKNFQFGIYSDQRPGKSKISTAAMGLVIPSKLINFGLGIDHFGDSNYNQEKIGLTISRKINSHLSLGCTFSYLYTYTRDVTPSGNFLVELGASYEINSRIRLGAFLFNPTMNRYSSLSSDLIPAFARYGASYALNDNWMIIADVQENFKAGVSVRTGIDYHFNSLGHFSMGVASNPFYFTFGFGLTISKWQLDYAASFHEILGYAPHFGVLYPARSAD